VNKLILIILSLLSLPSTAVELRPFKATYEVTRGGKVTGKQTTELKQISQHVWQLSDFMEGTRGMASVLGFERHETTEFIIQNGSLQATSHEMTQKAAFSKRRYRFSFDASQHSYSGKHKDNPFELQDSRAVISAHLIPLALGLAACQQQDELKLTILKSDKTRDYHFTINQQAHPVTAFRQFAANSQRTSQSWLSDKSMCLPEKQLHRESDEPEIMTRLTSFDWQ
jgi:hypothetical protein